MQCDHPVESNQSWWLCSSGREEFWRAHAGLWVRVRTDESDWSWRPTHPERSIGPGRNWPGAAARAGALLRCPAGPARWRGVSFFICQSDLLQSVVNGRQSAVQPDGRTQFVQGKVGLLTQQRAHLAMMGRQDPRLASRSMMAWPDISCPAALLQKLLHHAQRHTKALRYLFSCALRPVVGSKDPFTQIQRERSHERSLTQLSQNGYSFI